MQRLLHACFLDLWGCRMVLTCRLCKACFHKTLQAVCQAMHIHTQTLHHHSRSAYMHQLYNLRLPVVQAIDMPYQSLIGTLIQGAQSHKDAPVYVRLDRLHALCMQRSGPLVSK